MSYEIGWQAINLQMPKRVPRIEHSVAEYHSELVKAVTGLDVDMTSGDWLEEKRFLATQAFIKAWDYDLNFGCLVSEKELDAKRTHMGHADYSGGDFDDDISCPFGDEEDAFAFDPYETYGHKDPGTLTDRFNENHRWMKSSFPNCVTTTGVSPTLMSGMIYIYGWDMLLRALGKDPKRFGEVVNRYAS